MSRVADVVSEPAELASVLHERVARGGRIAHSLALEPCRVVPETCFFGAAGWHESCSLPVDMKRSHHARTPSAARQKLDALIRHNSRLGPYLRRVARASVAAAMLSGCSMSHAVPDAGDTGVVDGGMDAFVPDGSVPDSSMPDSSMPDSSMPDSSMPDSSVPDGMRPPIPAELCEPDGSYRMVHGLSLPDMPTYLGAVWGGDFGGPGSIADYIGEQCADATDPAACSVEAGRIVSETYQRGLVSTRGDAIETHLTEAELAAVVGDVDTAKEAALIAWHAGYEIYCSGDYVSSVSETPGGYRVVAYQSSGGCGTPWITTRFTLFVGPGGDVTVEDSVVVAEEEDFGCIGRRPVGLEACVDDPGAGVVGDYFAQVARLEESAVAAFELMIAELEGLGAPEALLAGAREARADEVRHTLSMGALARRFGAEPLRPKIAPAPTRSAFEVALENAVEGCVRETFGALVGAHQALRANDAAIAEAMEIVADDEIRHAELSWAVAAWLEPQLSDDERAEIAAAKRDAVVMLRNQASAPIDPELVHLTGMPDPAVTIAMVDQLARDIWA